MYHSREISCLGVIELMEVYDRSEMRTGVQDASGYQPDTDVQCDYVMVYGAHNYKTQMPGWKAHGYYVHAMIGVASNECNDYLNGGFDGRDHHDESQMRRNGTPVLRPGHEVIPYMVPTVSYSNYLVEQMKPLIDLGAEDIHLEEPEFWMESGYSPAFKREWAVYYGEPWQEPEATANGQFRASKLKQRLYTREIGRIAAELKEYALVKYNRRVRIYVAAHSLINYCTWKIVSPESALVELPELDGYVAQIWTGTARAANFYEGVPRERTFETAYLEYGVMQELVRGSRLKMWVLHDPVEDDHNHNWQDYRDNYYRTVTASLMHAGVSNYEVAPWPERVFKGRFPVAGEDRPSELVDINETDCLRNLTDDPGDKRNKETIPSEYATNLLTVMHTLRDMKQKAVRWESDTKEVGLFVADSCMFQRIYPDGTPNEKESRTIVWYPFFGLALPLLKHGLAVRPVQMDNLRRFEGYLNAYDTLVLSYEYMKPEYSVAHVVIAQWIRDGGLLIYVGDSSDVFHGISNWWNTGALHFKDPAEHLFELCGLGTYPADGLHRVGKGVLYRLIDHPTQIAKSRARAVNYREAVACALAAGGYHWQPSAHLILRRGKYVVTAVMDESVRPEGITLKGNYIDLYTASLDIVRDPLLEVGSVGLYLDLSAVETGPDAEILAAAGRTENFSTDARGFSFDIKGPARIASAARLKVRKPPAAVAAACNGVPIPVEAVYDAYSSTVLLRFGGSPYGVSISCRFNEEFQGEAIV